MELLYTQKILSANTVFDKRFLDTKALYLHCFNMLPGINYICDTDGEKAFAVFKEKYQGEIRHIHRYQWYKRKQRKYQFDRTVIILANNCIVEFDDDYCEILHDGKQETFLQEVTDLAFRFKERQRRQPLEINLVIQKDNALELRSMEIKRTKLDINLFYEDDFKETDQVIQKRLNKKNDKGIVLLHGLPGTGKTTYLRYLVGKIKKRVLFLSPSVANDLVSPEFIDLLADNPNTVLVIEDAENIIMDRKVNASSSVSNLLNISDGLLADFLNVQLICTFNNSLTLIDSALLRKGRLIAKYEFGKLGMEKAQRLSEHLGFRQLIHKPLTLAEITHPHEKEQVVERTEVIGFRRPETLMN
jgi:ATPase family associated with various cellular activities (AAA)